MGVPVQITMDCADPARLAGFWALALDYVEPPPPDGYQTWQEWVVAQGWPEEEWNSANAIEDPDREFSGCYKLITIPPHRGERRPNPCLSP